MFKNVTVANKPKIKYKIEPLDHENGRLSVKERGEGFEYLQTNSVNKFGSFFSTVPNLSLKAG